MTRLLAICYVGWLFDFYDLILFSFLIPLIAPDLGLTLTEQSWLLGAGLGASGTGGILFGWLADRYGRRPIMIWTILMYSIGTALSAFAPNLGILLILRIIAGLGIGGEWAVAHALVAESVESKQRGRAAALLQTGEPVGVALAAVTGLLIAPHVGWRMVMGISGLSALWALVVRASLPESSLWERERSHHTGDARARANAGRRSASARKPAMDWLRSPAGIWTLFRGFLLAAFKLGTYWTCYVWLPKFFLTRFHEPIGLSALWILTAQAGQFVGMLSFGRVADRVGRRPAFAAYSALTAAALLVLAFHWQALVETRTLFWPVMALMGVGSGCTAGFGSLLAELFPTGIRNFAMGTCYNLARGVQIFAPPVVAFFAARWDLAGALGVPIVLAVLTALWVWTLPETRDRDLSRIESA